MRLLFAGKEVAELSSPLLPFFLIVYSNDWLSSTSHSASARSLFAKHHSYDISLKNLAVSSSMRYDSDTVEVVGQLDDFYAIRCASSSMLLIMS